jgi:hypothetical protein
MRAEVRQLVDDGPFFREWSGCLDGTEVVLVRVGDDAHHRIYCACGNILEATYLYPWSEAWTRCV